MTDRELLELAAKAMRFETFEWHEDVGFAMYEADWPSNASALYVEGSYYWNPLIDSRDAFETAVKLGITVYGREIGGTADDAFFVDEADCGGDCVAATRRAIVLCAADKGARLSK